MDSATQEWQEEVAKNNFSVERGPYLQKIDGIVFGPNPQHGFVEDGQFYHPEFRFKFPVPGGWNAVNSASQVQMIPKSQDAAVLLLLAAQSSPSAAASDFAQKAKAQVLERDSIRVNGMSAERLLSEVSTEQNRLRVLSYFIQKENRVFVMHGYTTESRFSSDRNNFQNTMENFDHLIDRRLLNRQPDRLRIRRAGRNGTLEQVLRSFGTSRDELEQIAVLNGMELQDSIQRGTRIKTVERH